MINVEKISSFNLKELDYSMIYYQKQFWKVKREKCDQFYLNSLRDYLRVNLTAGKRVTKKYKFNLSNISKLNIWIPNSFQIDSKSIQKIPPQNELVELELKEDYCYFNLRSRLNVKVGCQMYFKNYPNDIQICPFRLTSYTYPLDSVIYKWKEPGLITNQLIKQINQYTLSLSKYQYNSSKYEDKIKYSFLEISLRFENHLSHYIMQIVVPTYFIISIVYLNLFMKPDGSPGRFLLTILTFISLVTIYTSNRDKLPALAYANAVDIWILGNLFFVFIAILELVMHSFIMKRRSLKEEKKQKKVRSPNSEIYIITPSHEESQLNNSKLRDDNMSNFMFSNGNFNEKIELNKSNENLTSVSSSNNLLTLNGRDTLNSVHTVHSSIENILNSRIIRSQTETESNSNEKKHPFDLDRFCRVWYPITYLFYNFVYWIILLNRWFDVSILKNNDE